MAPKKKADNELGSVVRNKGHFRVEVKLAGRAMKGPTRVERSTAEADLVAMRAFPRAEMPKLLADLMAADCPVQQEQVEVVSRQKRQRLSTPISKRPRSTTAPREEAAAEIATNSLGSTDAAADRPPTERQCAQKGVLGCSSGTNLQVASTPSAVTLCLRGLNIQWPFSQLILQGWKTIEARGYPLGHRNIASADAEVWIVETPGPSSRAEKNALVDGIAIAPRPTAAQIVGTVKFDDDKRFADRAAFRADAANHRIRSDGRHDWHGVGDMHGWHITGVRTLTQPQPAGSISMTGFVPRSFNAIFAAPSSGEAVSAAPPIAAGTDTPMATGTGPAVDAAPRLRATGPSISAASGSASSTGSAVNAEPHLRSAGSLANAATCSMAPETEFGVHEEYYEEQVAAWCGMHALNNLFGGPYVNTDACRLAASQVATALSQVGGPDPDAVSLHLHPETGWLSIDVINVLAASTLGVHVEGNEQPLAGLQDAGDGAAFLMNCNQQHWTVLQQISTVGPWVHTNSINTQAHASFHGRRQLPRLLDLLQLMADIQQHYGDVTLHQVRRASPLTGVHFLDVAGMRAMLPAEAPASHVRGADEIVAPAEMADLPQAGAGVDGAVPVVTVNVDGLGTYRRPPAHRMAAILERVLLLMPDVLLLQEVVDDMYDVVRETLTNWHIHRRHGREADYFLVTATRLAATAEDRCTSFAFPHSSGGRHLLTVRRGPWAFVNVHAESGRRAFERDERAAQLLHMSRLHEHDVSRVHVLAGDFNARPGEDHCLLREGWSDVWERTVVDVDADAWTWRQHANEARYDRVYTHDTETAAVRCVHVARNLHVWGDLTDHVALHVVLQRVSSVVPNRANCGPAALAPSAAPVASHNDRHHADTPAAGCDATTPPTLPRADISVVAIANAATRALRELWASCEKCMEDPARKEGDPPDPSAAGLVEWEDIPTRAGFKVLRPGGRGKELSSHSKVPPAEQLRQQQTYTFHVQWAEACGAHRDDFRREIDRIPRDQNKRGVEGIPQLMREKGCNERRHAVLACRAKGLQLAAAAAGNLLEGDKMSAQASAEMLELLSSQAARDTRFAAIPRSWRASLRLPNRPEALDVISAPGLFEHWLRSQAASSMGPEATQRWQRLAQQGQESTAPTFNFNLDDEEYLVGGPDHIDGEKLRRGKYPVIRAWTQFTWDCARHEVHARFGTEHKLCCAIIVDNQEAEVCTSTMQELFERLNTPPEDAASRHPFSI